MNASEPQPRDHRSLAVVVPAAGTGVRMGGVRKPFLTLRGEPILFHSLRPFLLLSYVRSIVVALADEDARNPPPWLAELDPRVTLVAGGASRTESVWAALQAVPGDVDLVAVHDAARPLVTPEAVQRCVDATGPNRGAVAGWPAVDTLKRIDETHRIRETLARDEIWHAHTPQVFPLRLLLRAYQAARESGQSATDDSALVEQVGGEVVMVEGDLTNLKVTRPDDLSLAEFLLGRREGT